MYYLSYWVDPGTLAGMARKTRLHVPGGVYHVILRGNGGRDIFFEPADRHFFYDLLDAGTERFGYRVHGFCLMTNHLHLVLQAGEAPLARPMQNLAFRYARRINRRRHRLGHLFQGRYKALLVDADAYLLTLVRYVHLNPVRAGLAAAVDDYPWSGHRAYLGLETLPWLTTDWVLGQFGRRLATARTAYGAFVAEGEGQGRDEAFHLGPDDSRVLGDDDFLARIQDLGREVPPAAPPPLEAIVPRVAAHYGISAAELVGPSRGRVASEARGMVALIARDSGTATVSAVAERFGRDPTTMSRVLGRIEDRLAGDARLAKALRDLQALAAQ